MSAVLAVTLCVTTCGLPLPVGEGSTPCGCGLGCRCSLASVLNATCCCSAKSRPSCCQTRAIAAGSCDSTAAATGLKSTEPGAGQTDVQLPPCCAARREAQRTRCAERDCLFSAGDASAKRSACCRPAGRALSRLPRVESHAAPDEPQITCACGPRRTAGWLVSVEPRLASRPRNLERPARPTLGGPVESEAYDRLVMGPEPPPPRMERA